MLKTLTKVGINPMPFNSNPSWVSNLTHTGITEKGIHEQVQVSLFFYGQSLMRSRKGSTSIRAEIMMKNLTPFSEEMRGHNRVN